MATTTALTGGNGAFGTTAFGRLVDSGNLTLDNGMTAGYGVQDGHTFNPPPDPRTYGGNPATAPKRIGVLRNVAGSLPNNVIYSLYFIFNPNQIVASFATNLSSIPPSYLYGSDASSNITALGSASAPGTAGGATNVPNLTNSQTVSWSLIFDRTYDMLFDPNPDYNRGVLRDTAALYNLMGTFASDGGVPVSTPCQVVFAQTASGQLWGFTGYISSVNITYGIFRHNMIPSRCEVDLQMTTTYVAAQAPSNSGAGLATVGASGGTGNIIPSSATGGAPVAVNGPPIIPSSATLGLPFAA